MTFKNAISSSIAQNQLSSYRILSYNVDTNIGKMESGPARFSHPEWRSSARMPELQKFIGSYIDDYKLDFIQIQEGRKMVNKYGEFFDSVTPIADFLASKNFSVIAQGYNPDPKSFTYITAYNPERFEEVGNESLYLTKTPFSPTALIYSENPDHPENLAKIHENTFGERWERSVLHTTLTEKGTNDTVHLFNVHFSIPVPHRLGASEVIRDLANKYSKVGQNPKLVFTGDFNTFPQFKGPEQIAIMTEGGLKDAVADLKTLDGQPLDFTFIAYPYDFIGKGFTFGKPPFDANSLSPSEYREVAKNYFDNDCQALGGMLDHVFYSGFESSEAYMLPANIFPDAPQHMNEDSVKKYILDHYDQGPAYASDHQPILGILHLETKVGEDHNSEL